MRAAGDLGGKISLAGSYQNQRHQRRSGERDITTIVARLEEHARVHVEAVRDTVSAMPL